MPFYELSCTACQHKFEVLQKFSDPLPPCEKCQSEVQRLISPTQFQLKGTGWSRTGYTTQKEWDAYVDKKAAELAKKGI